MIGLLTLVPHDEALDNFGPNGQNCHNCNKLDQMVLVLNQSVGDSVYSSQPGTVDWQIMLVDMKDAVLVAAPGVILVVDFGMLMGCQPRI